MSIKIIFKIILISLALLFIFPVFVFAAEVSIFPSLATTTLASSISISINVENVENLFAIQLDLIYDSEILEFVSIEEGDFLGSDGVVPEEPFIFTGIPGNLLVYYSRPIDELSGVTGSGNLLTFTFNTLATGTSYLNFQSEEGASFLIDPNLEFIETVWNNGEIIVIENEEPQPALDTTPPSTPFNFIAVAISSSQIDLYWSTSTDPEVQGEIVSGLAGYKIYRDGIEIATTSDTFYSDVGLTASTTYSYNVSAYDLAGNESGLSELTSTTTLAEVIPAQVIIFPSLATTSVGSEVRVSINVENVENLFAVAFDLIFNPDILTFISAEKANFLNQDGVSDDLSISFLRDPQGIIIDPGRLIVAHSRIAGIGGPIGISGSGTLMTLTFKVTATGTSSFIFQRAHLLNPLLEEILANWKESEITAEPPQTCISFVYSDWGACQPNNIQFRTIISSLPAGCVGGNPVLSQFCFYTAPAYEGNEGAFLPTELIISKESIKIIKLTENTITISWETSYPASSQVIYSQEGEAHILDLNDEKFGYTRITPEYNAPANINGTTTHLVTIYDLLPGTTYYYRTVSRGSLAISEEYSFSTPLTTTEVNKKNEAPVNETIPLQEWQTLARSKTSENSETIRKTGEEIINKTGEKVSQKTEEQLQKNEPQENQIIPELASRRIVNPQKSLMAAISVFWDKIDKAVPLIFFIAGLLLITVIVYFLKKSKK